jgi:uncharacterized membrane protein
MIEAEGTLTVAGQKIEGIIFLGEEDDFVRFHSKDGHLRVMVRKDACELQVEGPP